MNSSGKSPRQENRIKGVIVYLSRSRQQDLTNLKLSLSLLDRNFNNKFDYPVIVFHEDFDEPLMRSVSRSFRSRVRFEKVKFEIPRDLGEREIPSVFRLPSGLCFNLGFRHMCRFFAGPVFQEPSLREYDWYWRLDTDSFILSEIRYDVFRFMQEHEYWYGYILTRYEPPEVVENLWNTMKRYLKENQIQPTFLHKYTPRGEWDRSTYYTNFEISRLDFWRSPAYMSYFRYLDQSGGIYRHRWGDGPIHTFAVRTFIPEKRVHQFRDILYQHQGLRTDSRFRIIASLSNRIPQPVLSPLTQATQRISGFASKYSPTSRHAVWKAPQWLVANNRNMRDLFKEFYTANIWGGSGGGSSAEFTKEYRSFLQGFLQRYGVHSVLDLGCGDWQFSCLIDWAGIDYTGMDVVQSVIDDNARKYGAANIRFIQSNIVEDQLPTADLAIVKDVLQHWSNFTILGFLPKLEQFRYVLLVNSYAARNRDCRNGDTRPLDLNAPPFNLGAKEVFSFYDKKVLLLRTITDSPASNEHRQPI